MSEVQPKQQTSTSEANNDPKKEEKADDKQREDWEIQRDHHKQAGDNAFRCGGFKTAIGEYSKAISLDPDFLLAYSNRSAAFLKNSEKSKALKDAQKCVELDPYFSKGHSRLAAALHSLKRFEKAKYSYNQVLKIDPNNAAAKSGVEDCEKEIQLHREAHSEEKRKQKDQEEEEKLVEDNDDDLLHDFFADVEQVTQIKKEPEHPKATNAIKNDKTVLGTFEFQVDRLLQNNYEWRNLNPFYVLMLPGDATEDDISRRYKAMSLMLHPDKNGGSDRAQKAYDQVQKAKNSLKDPDRLRYIRGLLEEGKRAGELISKKTAKQDNASSNLEEIQEREIMRIFAQVEKKRRDVEERERKYEQRERQQEDEELEKERNSRQFDKKWRNEERVDKRVGNWRDFATNPSQKKKKKIK